LSIIGQYQKINISHLKFNISSNKRATSSKPRLRELDIENRINNLSQKNFSQNLKKNIVVNNFNCRSQTPDMIKSKKNLNNNNTQNNSIYFSHIQEEFIKTSTPNLKNTINTSEGYNLNRQVKIIPNKKKNYQILYSEQRKLIEKDRKNQEQNKKLYSSKNDREKGKDEKNKNILIEKEIKKEELEKEVSRLKNILNNQPEKIINYLKKLEELNFKKDNQIKFLENELANRIKENSELKRNNEILQAQISQNKGNINEEQNSLKYYEEPTLIGLNNLGATCFMNSALQCLSQIASLSNYFLKDSTYKMIIENNIAKQNKNLPQLSPAYRKLIKMLWDKNKKGYSFSPNFFMETVEKMNQLFKKGKAGDSKDFLIFILEQIHKELKIPANSQNHDFQKEHSIISHEFFGITKKINVCLYCKELYSRQGQNFPIAYNDEIFNFLIFHLKKVKDFRNNNNCDNSNIQINTKNSVSLNECFLYNQRTIILKGDNRKFCNICNQLYDSEFTKRIYYSPNIFILILDRGKDNKYDIKLDFSETLDLTQVIVVKDHPNMIYNLKSIITHYGQSGPNAHFIAFCKSPINNKWYKYDDAFVDPVVDVQKEIVNFGTPYILFYEKSK